MNGFHGEENGGLKMEKSWKILEFEFFFRFFSCFCQQKNLSFDITFEGLFRFQTKESIKT